MDGGVSTLWKGCSQRLPRTQGLKDHAHIWGHASPGATCYLSVKWPGGERRVVMGGRQMLRMSTPADVSGRALRGEVRR